jgi:hypothetical protein
LSLGVDGDIIFARSSRPVKGLDMDEVYWLMTQVAAAANYLRSDIAQEFKAILFDFDNE